MKKNTIVVVPIYKVSLSQAEFRSLKQGFEILKKRAFVLIVPKKLDRNFLSDIVPPQCAYEIESFNDHFFESIYGYNKLMLSKDFYQRFDDYSYVLIYHLDSYVFKDNLNKWLNARYDNIGGPWFSLRTGKLEPWSGNGGFCLRNVKAALATLQSNTLLFLPTIVWNMVKELPFRYWWKYKFVLMRLLFPIFQRSKRFIERYPFYEDKFWAKIAPIINKDFKVCPATEAMEFAFDAHPEKLYKLNNNKLPMGAHGWFRPERIDFWKDHIEELKQINP